MSFHIHHGDCIEHMATMEAASIDLAVFSPPFPAMYAYTSSERDIGNSEDFKGDAKLHLAFFYNQLARLIKPGRVVVVHVMQIPRMKRSGEVGLHDFRGLNIRIGERAGLVYEYDWMVRKNPQAQAIRTRSRELQFSGLEADRAKQRGTLNDYLIKFRAPGANETPIQSKEQVSRNDWIAWAEGCWSDIRETDTLNVSEGRSGLQDSYEQFYQCVKRSNRVGSKLPLNVHIPVTELEEPMIETVLRKAARVEADTIEQESLFREQLQK